MDEFADDFAFLCDDIIHDVLQCAHFERLRTNSPSISLFGGRWGEIVETYSYFKLVDNEIEEYRLDAYSVSFTAPASTRKDVAVNSIRLSRRSDFNKLEHLAANAYEWLEVHCVLIPEEFLENLGNRFTSIIWRENNLFSSPNVQCRRSRRYKNQSFTRHQLEILERSFQRTRYPATYEREDVARELGVPESRVWRWFLDRRAKQRQQKRAATNGNQQIRPANPSWIAVNREIEFFKRQLKSPHLRILECNSPVLARPEFTDLLVDFVQKKNFLTLKSTSSECLSPQVFKAAYEAWLQRSEREHLLSSITAPISTEDLRKLTAIYARDKHPTANHYETLMTWKERWNGTHELTMEFSRDIIKY